MSVEILTDGQRHVLIDSNTDSALRPVFWGDDEPDKFLEWLAHDARTYQPHHLAFLVDEWRKGLTYEQVEGPQAASANASICGAIAGG